ncbi:MAG: Rid family detoxifying hydrolase [Euryarchaeota archaeon]|nr:Rid family detoxifying hydrolase [Euryarchaeota archaeon]
MSKTVMTEKAPKPVGPYSQAIVSKGLVFCSGQIGIDPSTGKLVEGGIERETEQVLDNLRNVLDAAGSSMDKVLRCTIYVTEMSNFQKVNAIYGKRFQADPPARTTVGVIALPMKAMVEIDVIAEITP